MAFYQYQPYVKTGPTGYVLSFDNFQNDNGENIAVEVAQIDGTHYVYVPDDCIEQIPKQNTKIKWEAVNLTDELKAEIKKASRLCFLIEQEMQQRIRDKYSLEDELYLNRITAGVMLGAYQFEQGEQEQVLGFGMFVEAVRQWGRAERAKIGL